MAIKSQILPCVPAAVHSGGELSAATAHWEEGASAPEAPTAWVGTVRAGTARAGTQVEEGMVIRAAMAVRACLARLRHLRPRRRLTWRFRHRPGQPSLDRT